MIGGGKPEFREDAADLIEPEIEDLDVYGGDDAEDEGLRYVRRRLERWLENKSGILSLQGFQDEVFKERAEEAWEPGHWEPHGRAWRWTEGHWVPRAPLEPAQRPSKDAPAEPPVTPKAPQAEAP